MIRQTSAKRCAAVLVLFGGLILIADASAEDVAFEEATITPLPATIPDRVRTIVLSVPAPVTPADSSDISDTPIRVVTSCKREPFVRYQQDSRAGIDKAWQDTQDGRYGYGFSDQLEYKKWQDVHSDLFASVAVACEVLSTCAQRAGDKAKKACVREARSFTGWQHTGQQFLERVKSMETGMAPSLCAVTPAFTDLSDCFSRLAERIDDVCRNKRCQEVSQCWRSVAFLDQAIHQAESACGFAGQDLSMCRGFVEATGRREAKFAQCQSEYKSAKIGNFPVL